MNIHIIFRAPFPYGGVGANRVISYAKEIAIKHNAFIHCIQPTKNYPGCKNNKVIGRFQNIFYFYPSGKTTWPHDNINYLYKLYYCLIAYFYSYKYIYRKRRNSIIYLYSISFCDIVIYYIISRILNIKLLQERSEIPHLLRKQSLFTKLIKPIYTYTYIFFIYKLFDALVVETDLLRQFYQKFLRKSAKIFILPNTIDFTRFENVKIFHKFYKKQYFAYAGNMSEFDGIEILIDAFNIFHKQFPSVYLLLIGKCEDNLFNLYKSKVRKYQLEEYIIFTGKLTNTDIPQYLVTATALVLASPVSIRNSVSLPYKLGEYLAAKRPVIVTGVGAIPSILHDGIDAFIAEPGNPNSLCEKLIKCLSMTDEERSLMGKKGQEVAYQLFNSVYHSHRLQMFLEGLS